jgi:multiple sugar transport system ATP-binding protein
MAQLDFDAVTKCFPGKVTALDRFTLSVADRELVVLVGPSGAGKTTALRVAAGLERATSGSVRMDGRSIDSCKPRDRDIAMVFQQPALYPHLTVRDNVSFALRMRRTSQGDIDRHIAQSAADLGITGLFDRFPGTLSGGQAQRVALARALVRRPKALLLDEPLASLDAPLRSELRRDLREAHRRDPVTTIYVTHDQEEALALADRLVVVRAGRIEQIGTPQEVYERPANRFVAGFVGSPAMNFLDGKLTAHGEQVRFEAGDWWLAVDSAMRSQLMRYVGQTVTLGLRPQDLTLAPVAAVTGSPQPIELLMGDIEYCGDRWLVRGAMKSGVRLVAAIDNADGMLAGASLCMYARSARASFFAPGGDGINLACV